MSLRGNASFVTTFDGWVNWASPSALAAPLLTLSSVYFRKKPISGEVVDSARRLASACAPNFIWFSYSRKAREGAGCAREACMLLRGWDKNLRIDGHLKRAPEDQPLLREARTYPVTF